MCVSGDIFLPVLTNESSRPSPSFPGSGQKSAKNIACRGDYTRCLSFLAPCQHSPGYTRGSARGWAPFHFDGAGPVSDEQTELLVRLLSQHQDQMFRYIFALVPHADDARDVLQETSVALCRKFGDYDTNKPFLPWAYSFAYLEVLKYPRARTPSRSAAAGGTHRKTRADREQHESILDARLEALEACLAELSPADRQLDPQPVRRFRYGRIGPFVRGQSPHTVSQPRPDPAAPVALHRSTSGRR